MVKTLLKLVLLFLIIVLVVILGITIYYGFDLCLDYVLDAMGQPEKKEKALEMLTSELFVLSQILLGLFVLLLSFLLFKINYLYPYVQKAIIYIFEAFKSVFKELKSKEVCLILLIPLLSSLYYAVSLPVSYDEAYTYLYLVSKPFYISALFYPSPNNHILYSLSANLTEYIPFASVLFCLRLPSILFSFLTSLVGFSFVKRFFGKKLAIFVVALFPVLFMSIYYSYMARGYSLMVLLFIIVLFSVYNILERNRKKDWMFFVIGSVLGFYTIPSFLYPFITLNIILLLSNIKLIKRQIIYNLIATVSILILYTPVMILNGLGALANNRFVTPDKMTRFEVLQTLPSFLYQSLEEISGIPGFIVLLICLFSLFMFILNKDKKNIMLWVVFMSSPFFLLGIHNVIPFPRTFVYYGFIIVFLFSISISKYLNKIGANQLLIIVLLIQVMGILNFNYKIKEYELFNFESKNMSDLILDDKSTYYMDYDALCTINHSFEVQSRRDNIKKRILVDEEEKISADTISGYNYIIIGVQKDETKTKKPIYSNIWQNVYLGKENPTYK